MPKTIIEVYFRNYFSTKSNYCLGRLDKFGRHQRILVAMEISAECERKAGLWEVRVPQLGDLIISSRRLDSASEQIKDLVHQSQGVERCDIIVKIETTLPGVVCDLEAAQDKMLEARRLQEEASREIREIVSRLREEGLSMRDIGMLLQISPQRVAQLTGSV